LAEHSITWDTTMHTTLYKEFKGFKRLLRAPNQTFFVYTNHGKVIPMKAAWIARAAESDGKLVGEVEYLLILTELENREDLVTSRNWQTKPFHM
jgi:hypothetical protein